MAKSKKQDKKEEEKKPRRANGQGTFYHRQDGRIEFKAVVGMAMDSSYIRKSFYGKTESDAWDSYLKYLKDNPIPLEKIKTVEQWVNSWLPTYKKGKVTDGTYYEYELIVNNVIVPNIGKVKLPELRRIHIEKMMRTISKFSVSRQKKVCFLTKAMLKAAVEDHFCKENVAANITPPKEDKKEIEIFPPEDIAKLLNYEHHFAPVVKFHLYTGMRRGEIIALSWRNVDLKHNIIHVKQALSDGEIKDRTKGKKDRIVPIVPELKSLLETLPHAGFTVFCIRDGKPMTKDYYNYWYEKFLNLTGVEYKSGHKCRHSFISYAINSGMNIRLVQEIAGHADLEQTENYAHIIPKDFKKNVRKFKY
jgi:integrase